MAKPRIALISHSYLEKQYRGKLPVIGRAVDLTVISPDQFPSLYGLHHADFADVRDYAFRLYPCHFLLPIHTSTRYHLASRDFKFWHEPPDIIHVENEESSFLLLQTLLYRRRYAPKAKVIVFVWSNLPLGGFKGRVLNALAKWARPQIDFFIAGNSDGKHLLVQSGVPEHRVEVFPQMGVDIDYFMPASVDKRMRFRSELGIQEEEFVIGFVGRFCEEKGIFDLLDAFRQIRSSFGKQVRLLCVGDGPLRSDLSLLHPSVILVSPGGSSQVLPYYQIMDVLVLPSRTTRWWKEQFGRVIVEAMACGVPVVGSSSGEIPNVIGNAGVVFPEGEVASLANELQLLADAPQTRLNYALSGRARVFEKYSDKKISEQTLQVYARLTGTDFLERGI